MAIDMKKMRSKLTQLKSRGGSGGGNFWKPQDGSQTIRILPTEDEDPFKQFFFHYNVGEGGGFLCPKNNFGDNCPVCSFVKTLYQQGDDESKEVARGLNVKSRFFSPELIWVFNMVNHRVETSPLPRLPPRGNLARFVIN